MSVNCPIVVSFEVSKFEVLEDLGRKHLETMKRRAEKDDDDYDPDAQRFLQYVAEGKGIGLGPKGDMFTWGNVGNYGSLERFVDSLRGFWQDLFRDRAIMNCDGVVVMFQQEQSPFMKITEIVSARKLEDPGALVVRTAELPFPLYGWYSERSDKLVPPCHTEHWDD